MIEARELPRIVEVDDSLEAVQSFFESQGWTDGLPIVPPTLERVEAMCAGVDYGPDEIIASLAPRNGTASVERIATNAVMAGCRPEYMPVLVTAVKAIADPVFNLNGIQTTTHPCGVMVLLNGPVGREVGVHSGYGCFGPGWRANAAIGRAMRLILLNIGGATPAESDRATQGSPAKFSLCAAENEDASPWAPLHVERGFAPGDSTVTVLACEGPHNMNDHESIRGVALVRKMAGTMRAYGSNNLTYSRGTPLVVFGPEHARAIGDDGFSKDDIRHFLWENAYLPGSGSADDWPRTERRIGDGWQGIDIIVAGGAGKHSCWFPTFGMTATVTRRIERKDGTPVTAGS